MESVPHIYILPPREANSPKLNMIDYEIDTRLILEGTETLFNEIEKISGVKIKVTVPSPPILAALSCISVLVALIVSFAAFDVKKALLWYQSPKIWVVMSVVSNKLILYILTRDI